MVHQTAHTASTGDNKGFGSFIKLLGFFKKQFYRSRTAISLLKRAPVNLIQFRKTQLDRLFNFPTAVGQAS